ncbi:tripeptidyl peptidase A [Peniophora sp. CONT]|nr:tripeptidyl peptidase A [Peniophora sp. CONT]
MFVLRSPTSLLLAVSALAAHAAATPYRLKERVPEPRNWIKREPAPAEHVVSLKFGLHQAGFDELERHLYEVSDPSHARYGQHLTKGEVETLVAPHADSLATVTGWLKEHGLEGDDLRLSAAQDWVTVRVPVALAEAMLDTKFHVWEHSSGDSTLVRTTSYSLPDHVHPHIELVHPTTYFNRARALKTTFHFSELSSADTSSPAALGKIAIPGSDVTVDPSCNTTITVDCIKELYNAVNYTVAAADVNQLGITGYLEQFANFQDLQSFYAKQVPEAKGTSFNVTLIDGGENNQTLSEAGAEANLDVQYGFGITFPTPGIFWSTGGSPPFTPDQQTPTDSNEPYETWLEFVLAQDFVPQTISTSYADDEQTVPIAYAQRVCADFAQLGARGVSLLFGSGDGGVGDGDSNPATSTDCVTNDGTNTPTFLPLFPASCPFITSVGGTINVPEVAVDFSGGGLSNYFARPAYQDEVVPAYLDSLANGTYAGLFNASGRGIPDVAAQADKFQIFLSGRAVSIGGTSAATPTFAGIISLLNDARLSQGLPSLGFLNPLIYSANVSATFNDITVGSNPGCGTQGFNATEGWDPITGFGTPNFGLLKAIVAP